MWNIILNAVLPYAIKAIVAYIKSTSTKSDDKVLDVVKDATRYLAESDNNTVTPILSESMQIRKMTPDFYIG